jgi:hypothetical protein
VQILVTESIVGYYIKAAARQFIMARANLLVPSLVLAVILSAAFSAGNWSKRVKQEFTRSHETQYALAASSTDCRMAGLLHCCAASKISNELAMHGNYTVIKRLRAC